MQCAVRQCAPCARYVIGMHVQLLHSTYNMCACNSMTYTLFGQNVCMVCNACTELLYVLRCAACIVSLDKFTARVLAQHLKDLTTVPGSVFPQLTPSGSPTLRNPVPLALPVHPTPYPPYHPPTHLPTGLLAFLAPSPLDRLGGEHKPRGG